MTAARNAAATEVPSQRIVVPKAEQARRTRALIVRTGIRCLATHGFAATTMLLIAREAGISRGPLHYHFADRNALMAAIAEALPQGASGAVLKRLMVPKTVPDRLKVIVDIALEEHLGEHHFAAMELLLAARNDAGLAEAIRPHFLAGETAIDDWWVEHLAMLKWPTARLVAFRHVLVACLRGLALDHLLQGDAAAHRHALELLRDMILSFGRADDDRA